MDIIDKLKRKYDKIVFESKEEQQELEVISTGSLSLDVSTGIGGIPRGRFTTIYGAESSGKTTLCLEIARQALILGMRVAYIDVEQTLSYDYIESVTEQTNLENLLLAHTETAEEALGLAELLIKGDKKLGIEGGKFELIIVDSVAALSTKEEMDKDLDEKTVASSSRVLGPFFRKNAFAIREHNIAFILVNQVRANIGGYGGYVFPGGFALKHFSSLILFLSPGSKITKGDDIIGILIKFVVKKNKNAPPFRSFTIPFTFGNGVDLYRDAAEFATHMGIIKKRGSWYYLEGGEDNKVQGVVGMMNYLKEHPEELDKIKNLCYNSLSKQSSLEDEELEMEEFDE